MSVNLVGGGRVSDLVLDEVTYERLGSVVVITLNRPKMLNAISARFGGTRDQIVHAIELAEADPEVGCIVLRGAGRAFCGGGDLTGNARRETVLEDLHFAESAAKFHSRVVASRLPMIAAVHGHCLGAGLLLATSCDFVIAAEDAGFGFPEGRIGLIGASAVVSVVGRQWAKFLMLTGETISATKAQEIGLVLAVAPTEALFDRALDLAERIARMPRHGVELNRRAIDAVADASGDAAARTTALAQDAITLGMAAHATAPDGRTFRSIITEEGMDGMKRARAAQYDTPWLAANTNPAQQNER
jgi:enoyl-CoA hydratase/carnithine racemase